jgi:hypothetical protein
MTKMSDHEAYRILTRELTNMHHSERTALDNDSVRYRDALDLVKRGMHDEATEVVIPLVTVAGQTWRAKQNIRFLN